jgi:uncharacterized 2Fe-2S/4Fe-4S cluster protein (DUF4445 family)
MDSSKKPPKQSNFDSSINMRNNRYEEMHEYDDEFVIDKQTEQDVINTLMQQNRKIAEYEEVIADLNLEVSQIDVHKQQIASLQSQIRVLDEKLKLTAYDTETVKIAELEGRISYFIDRERNMNQQMKEGEQEIVYLGNIDHHSLPFILQIFYNVYHYL